MILDIDLPQFIAFVIGVVLPLLTGLVTRWNATGHTRALVLLGLSVITSFLTELVNALTTGQVFDAGAAIIAAFTTFLIGVGMHFGYWQTTDTSRAAREVGGFIGGSPRPRGLDGGTVAP